MRPRLLVVAAAVLWGTTGTAQALAPDAATPLGVGAVRLVLGAVVLVAVAGRATLGLLTRAPRLVLGAGAACVSAYQLTFFAAVERTGVAAGTIVAIGSAPVLAGALGWLVRGERPAARWWPATALAVCGGGLLVAGGGGDVRLDGLGVALAVGAGAAYAGYTVAAKGLLDTDQPLVVMAALFGLGGLLLLPLLVAEPLGWLGEPAGAAVALHLGVLTVAVAYVLFGSGLRGVQVATAGTLTLAEPVTAALLGVVLLDEVLSPLAWLGASAVLAGLVLLATPPPRRGGAPRRARR